jgi:ABC-type transporter Mla MlaB component
MLEVVPYLRRLKLRVDAGHDGDTHAIRLRGVASFLTLPKLSAVLEDSPSSKPVQLDLSGLEAIDHTTAEMVRDWFRRRTGAGALVSITGADPRLPVLTA